MFIGGNVYLNVLFGLPNKYELSFFDYGNLFPDPYTFHYEKDNYLKDFFVNKGNYPGGEFAFWGYSGDFLEEWGQDIGFFKLQIVQRAYSVWIYLKAFLSLIVFGGMLTWFFICFGVWELFKEKKYSVIFFSSAYFISWFFCLVFLKTTNYLQLLILSLPISILAGLGIYKTAEIISQSFHMPKLSAKISMAVAGIFLFLFFQISWWNFRESYIHSASIGEANNFVKTERGKLQFNNNEVTAVGWTQTAPDLLSYYFNGNFIYFAPETIKKLADKKELNKVFKKYNITGFVGYDDELSEIISKNTKSLKSLNSL